MRVFLTGATGFIGSAITEELHSRGHTVAGLARSDFAAAALTAAGVEICPGDVAEPAKLAEFARASDGVIHCAFGHDFSRYAEMGELDLRAVLAMADALAGTGKPFIVTSGMTASSPGRAATENEPAKTDGMSSVRGRPEAAAIAAAERGVRSVVVRLPPSVHDVDRQGLASHMIALARETGVSAYIGEGANVWSAVHRRDAARLYTLALELGRPGERFHAVAEEGVTLRAIAEAIGAGLNLPVRSIPVADAAAHFGWRMPFAMINADASSAITRERLGWEPCEPGLIEGLGGAYLQNLS
ncbi:MAG: SDR family oxidoreductase [bacterium]